ncbi:MAG: hypothetical protein NVV74_24910 [Magnetospirillum sp.]|nr:hypothetical protein [Magnetospirillum sp.]
MAAAARVFGLFLGHFALLRPLVIILGDGPGGFGDEADGQHPLLDQRPVEEMAADDGDQRGRDDG